MKTKWRFLFNFPFLLSALFFSTTVTHSREIKEWSIFVYMAADNDLTPYALWDLYEMERSMPSARNLGATTSKTNVVVELDTWQNDGLRRYLINENKNQFYDFHIGKSDFEHKSPEEVVSSRPIMVLPERGPGSVRAQAVRLQRFLDWGMKHFPAKKTMVIIWGHGEGHIGPSDLFSNTTSPRERTPRPVAISRYLTHDMVKGGALDVPKRRSRLDSKPFGGVAFDYSEQTYLDTSSLKTILRNSRRSQYNNRKIDILAFDACLMQSLEVVHSLADEVDFIIGSAQIQDYLGLPYRFLLDEINSQNGEKSAYDIARILPHLAEEAYFPYDGRAIPLLSNEDNAATFTLSSISTHEFIYSLRPALFNLKNALIEYILEDPMREMELLFILENSPTFMGETRDLGLFLGLLKKLLYEERKVKNLTSPVDLYLEAAVNRSFESLLKTSFSYTYGPFYTGYLKDSFTDDNAYLLGLFKGISFWMPDNAEIYASRKDEFQSMPWLFRPSLW